MNDNSLYVIVGPHLVSLGNSELCRRDCGGQDPGVDALLLGPHLERVVQLVHQLDKVGSEGFE